MIRYIVFILLIATAAPGQAAMLNLIPQGVFSADITTSFSSATYNATTDLLNVSGSATAIDYDKSAPPDSLVLSGGPGNPASFKISVHIDAAGAIVGPTTSTDLNILGLIPSGPHPSAYGPLLTGQLINFGYANNAPHRLLEFIFKVTGGSQAAQFGPKVGVVFDTINGFNGTFLSSFSTSISGNADNFAVPEPSSLMLCVIGAGLSIASFRRRRRHTADLLDRRPQ